MKIINAKVRWGDTNRLQVLVDRIPKDDELVFECTSDKGFWYAEKDGYVKFYSGHPDKEGKGFGGRSYELNTKNNGSITLVGPYDSSARSANKAGFKPCLDVSMTTDSSTFRNDGVFLARSMTKEKAEEAIQYATKALGLKQAGYKYEPYK